MPPTDTEDIEIPAVFCYADQRRGRSKPLPVAEICIRYVEGESVESLAADFGVSESTIRARLRAEGGPLRGLSRAD